MMIIFDLRIFDLRIFDSRFIMRYYVISLSRYYA